MNVTCDSQTNKNSTLLNHLYMDQRRSTHHTTTRKQKNKSRRICGSYFCIVIWSSFLAGILLGGVVLAVIIALYLQDQSKVTTQSTSAMISLRWSSTAMTVAGKGSGGSNSNPLNGPYGFTWDSSNHFYIAELGGHRVTKWIPEASSGTTVAGFPTGTPSNTSVGLLSPCDVLLESNGDMYVVDRGNNRLQFFPSGSNVGITKAGTGSNTSISFNWPTGIVRNSKANDLYVVNWFSHRIISYPSGSIIAGGNGAGNMNRQLNAPIGLLFDELSESLIIANYGGHSLVRWPLGLSNWTLLAGVPGSAGATSTRLNGPVGIAMDPMGNVYVADSNNHRIQIFMNGQSEGITIAGITGLSGSNSTRLSQPYWVKLDNQLNLYISDKANGRIQKFQRIR